MASTIVAAFGLEVRGDAQQMLQQFLHKKRLLLVLDNFEHLLAAVGLVTTLLQQAPALQILVTSRERLNVRGEQLYPVSGLAYTPERLAPAPATGAVQLFVHSAQQSQPDFALREADRPALLRVCQLVQGMPLGLEMAAAWTSLLSVEEIATEIARSADFLAVDWPDVPERQRSLRAVFQWSWRLLPEVEQRLLRQLALFVGSFTRSAAEQIAEATLRPLTNLLNKSLVQLAHTVSGTASPAAHDDKAPAQRRYELHPLVRQFAAEQTTAAAERLASEQRYSQFYLTLLTTQEAALRGMSVREAVQEIYREFDHIRQAWQWAIDHGQWELIEQGAYALAEFLAIVGRSSEGEQLFQLAVDQYERQVPTATNSPSAVRAYQRTLSKLVVALTFACYHQGKVQTADLAQQAVQLGQVSGFLEAQLMGYYTWWSILVRQERYAEAQPYFDQVGRLFAQVASQGEESLLLRGFAWRYQLGLFSCALQQGQYAEAQAYGEKGLRLAQTQGSLRGQMTLRMNLTALYLEQGSFAKAQQEIRLMLAATQQIQWRWGECMAQQILGFILTFCGEYGDAFTHSQYALRLAQELGEAELEVEILIQVAYLYALLGDSHQAQTLLPHWSPEAEQTAPIYTRYPLQVVRTLLSWRAGQLPAAQRASQLALTLANQFNNRWAQVCAQVYCGHIQTDCQAWCAASEAYQQALDLCGTFHDPALGVEAQAGMAQIALRQGDTTAALQWVEAMLPLLTGQIYAVTTPCFPYLIGYQVLAANGDVRAGNLLQQGYDLLLRMAGSLDEGLHSHCWATVPCHRTLVAAYHKVREQTQTG